MAQRPKPAHFIIIFVGPLAFLLFAASAAADAATAVEATVLLLLKMLLLTTAAAAEATLQHLQGAWIRTRDSATADRSATN